MRETIARMKHNEKERAYLLAVLDLWAQAKSQGINPDTVKSFSFDPQFAAPKLLAEARKWPTHYDADGRQFVRPPVFNYVRHHGGGTTQLDPPLKAVYRED